MNLYQVISHYDGGYDTYDSFICVAKTAKEARTIHPCSEYGNKIIMVESNNGDGSWVHFQNIHLLKVIKLGKASPKYKEAEVILSSFNAG